MGALRRKSKQSNKRDEMQGKWSVRSEIQSESDAKRKKESTYKINVAKRMRFRREVMQSNIYIAAM